ncbi:MAG: hypothetical protein LBG96_16195 [Tannerella sp.]|jgi:hypothetical protein|nr:hypothetical protein [Tannerella sp.]
MKTYLSLLVFTPLLTACFSDGFYDNINATPQISTTIDISSTDTLKIGKLKNSDGDIYFDFPVTVTDDNSNLQTLTLSVDTSFIKVTNARGEKIPTVYDLNDQYNFSGTQRMFRLVPVEPGDYTITATVTDRFGASDGLSKKLHVFDNLPPKCKVTETFYILDQILFVIYVDIRASFDQDAEFGGAIASYHAIYHYTWDTPSIMGTWAVDDDTPGKFSISDWYEEAVGYIEAWVVDNEGAESEHIRIDPVFRQ